MITENRNSNDEFQLFRKALQIDGYAYVYTDSFINLIVLEICGEKIIAPSWAGYVVSVDSANMLCTWSPEGIP